MIADNDATNGMLHLMDSLLYPFPQSSALEFLQNDPDDFGSLYRLVEFAGMDLKKILSGSCDEKAESHVGVTTYAWTPNTCKPIGEC